MTTGAVPAAAVAKRAAVGRILVGPVTEADPKGDGGPEVRSVEAPEAGHAVAAQAGEVEAHKDLEEARVLPGGAGPVIMVHHPSLNIGARHRDSVVRDGLVRCILGPVILGPVILDRGISERDTTVPTFDGEALADPANSPTMATTAIMAGTMNAMPSADRVLEGDVVMVMHHILPAGTAGGRRRTLPVIRALTKWRG